MSFEQHERSMMTSRDQTPRDQSSRDQTPRDRTPRDHNNSNNAIDAVDLNQSQNNSNASRGATPVNQAVPATFSQSAPLSYDSVSERQYGMFVDGKCNTSTCL